MNDFNLRTYLKNNPLLKEGVSQWLIDSFIEGVEDQSQFGEEWNIHAEAGTEDYDNLRTAAEEVIAGTDSEDTTEEELIAAAQAQLNGGDKVTYYAEDEIASRVRKLGKENGIANADIEEYVGELSGFFEPDAYKNTTDAELLDDLKIYIKDNPLLKENNINETLDDEVLALANRMVDAMGGADNLLEELIRAMSTDDAMLYLKAIARDYGMFNDGE